MYDRRGNRPPAKQARSKSRRVRKREREQVARGFVKAASRIACRARNGRDCRELFHDLRMCWDSLARSDSPPALACAMSSFGVIFGGAKKPEAELEWLLALARKAIPIIRRFNADELVMLISPFARLHISPTCDFLAAWSIGINDRWHQFWPGQWLAVFQSMASLKFPITQDVLDNCLQRGRELSTEFDDAAWRVVTGVTEQFPHLSGAFAQKGGSSQAG